MIVSFFQTTPEFGGPTLLCCSLSFSGMLSEAMLPGTSLCHMSCPGQHRLHPCHATDPFPFVVTVWPKEKKQQLKEVGGGWSLQEEKF